MVGCVVIVFCSHVSCSSRGQLSNLIQEIVCGLSIYNVITITWNDLVFVYNSSTPKLTGLAEARSVCGSWTSYSNLAVSQTDRHTLFLGSSN